VKYDEAIEAAMAGKMVRRPSWNDDNFMFAGENGTFLMNLGGRVTDCVIGAGEVDAEDWEIVRTH
jgi:hypothetical protein